MGVNTSQIDLLRGLKQTSKEKHAESKNRPAAISDKIIRRINQSQKIRAGDNHESAKRAKILRAVFFIGCCILQCDK